MINIKGRVTSTLKGSISGETLQKLRDKRCLNVSTRFKNKSSRCQRVKTRIGTKGVGQRQEPSTGLTKQFKLIGYLPWYRGQVAERSCVGLQIPSNRVQLPTYPLDLYFPAFLDPNGNDEWPRVTCYTNFGLWYKGKVIIGVFWT